MKLTAVFEKVGEWWLGYVEELPGANTQGETLDETRENLREAVQLIIGTNRELLLEQIEGHEVIREPLNEVVDQLARKICKDLGFVP